MRTIARLMVMIGSLSMVYSGVNLGAGINSYYSDNIFLNSTEVPDFVTVISADINYTAKNLNLYFDGSFSMFTENPEFNSTRIEPGIEVLKYLKGRSYVYLNLSYPILSYRDYYTDFNYYGPSTELGFKYYLAPTLLFKSGYSLEWRTYPNFSSFDFSNHTLFLEINKFFRSQTTLRFQAGFNYRYYRHIAEIIPGGDWELSPDLGEVNSMSVPNVSGILRISQGIGSRAGLFAEAELRKNFRGLDEAATLINHSYVVYPYNDNYLWDGSRLTLGIRVIPFAEIMVSGSISFLDKNYPGIYIMDEEGIVMEPETERADSLTSVQFSISKKFRKLSIFLDAQFRDNRSLDYFFDYRMLTLSGGFRYHF